MEKGFIYMVVTDARNCQRETAKILVKGKGGDLPDAKGSQGALKKEMEGYIQDTYHFRRLQSRPPGGGEKADPEAYQRAYRANGRHKL